MPTRRHAGFWIKGAKRERSHAQHDCMQSWEHGEHPPFDAGSRMAQALKCDGVRGRGLALLVGQKCPSHLDWPPFYEVAGSITRADPCSSLAGRGPYQDSTLAGLRP